MLKNNTEMKRYELFQEDKLVAVARYTLKEEVITFTHTEAMPEFQSQGYGSTLAQQALDDVSTRGWSVVPACSFIANFISTHPEYQKLVRS